MKSEDFIKANNDILITETLLKVNVPADQIVSALREHRTTGQLTFHFIQGGIRSVILTEKTNPTDPQRDKIREILGR